MRIFLSLLSIFAVATALGQPVDNEPANKELWLTAKLYPTVSGNTIFWGRHEFYSTSTTRATLSGGLELTKVIKNRWLIETGVILNDWGFEEVGENDAWPGINTHKEQLFYLTLPATAIYRLKRVYVGLGLNASYFLQRNHTKNGVRTTHKTPRAKTGAASDYWLVGAHGKIGLNLRLSKRLGFRPELYGIYSHDKASDMSRYREFVKYGTHGLYSVGLGLGLDFKLNAARS